MFLNKNDEEDEKDDIFLEMPSRVGIVLLKKVRSIMLGEKVVIYCICDEVWKAFNLKDDPQCNMSSPEIMAFSVISALYHGCNYHHTCLFSKVLKYFPKILSLSQLVRRIHRIPYQAWMMVFYALQLFLRNQNKNIFIIDSFPIKAYQNHKGFRARIDFQG
ncbi:MAG: hypothetical protein Tsb0021_16200 [Chlamydiales bacterium]